MAATTALRSGRSLSASLRGSTSATGTGIAFQGILQPARHFCSDSETSSITSSSSTTSKFTYPNVPNTVSFPPGIYKAILVGKVGQAPNVKTLPNGAEVVSFALGTGGLRNNRRARKEETTEAYAERSFTQWHKVCVFRQSILSLAKQIKQGMSVYVEGSIETRVFTDPVTGTLKRVREISVRQNGRLYIMGTKPLLAADFEN